MGQAVTVANASGGKLYVKVQSSFQVSEKADLVVGGSTPSTSADGSATGKIDVEVDGKALEPGHVAIENNQSLKFARSFFTRRLLSISTDDKKAFICYQFLVPCGKNIIVAPDNTVRYAKSGHKWVDTDGDRHREKRSSTLSERNNSVQNVQ